MSEGAKPSEVRGETLREVAAILRGAISLGQFSFEDMPEFFEHQAAANDILLSVPQKD